MRTLVYAVVFVAGGLSLASATIQNTERGDRPTDLIAADLGIPEPGFVQCFMDVQPAQDKTPTKDRQRMNKALLLPCLQAENPKITNRMLDEVMDRYRPEGPITH